MKAEYKLMNTKIDDRQTDRQRNATNTSIEDPHTETMRMKYNSCD